MNRKILLLLALVLACNLAYAATEKLALKGYDPVAYFTAGKPEPGRKDFTHEWQGATFRFASAENLAAFKQAPEKYAPQFGGYCAYAVSQNYTAPIDPAAWDIVNGKLYLNYNKAVQKKWREQRDTYIAQAEKNWPALQAKEQKAHE